MSHSVFAIPRLSYLLATSAMVALTCGSVSAQQVLTADSYAAKIKLKVPSATAPAVCTPLTASAPGTMLELQQTFFDDFNTLDLQSNRWTPHFDGGYDPAKKQWLGYDWISKRTQTAGHEQQLYVDPSYKGTAKNPLGLNPFIVEDGVLHILAQKAPDSLKKALSDYEYTSGVLTTRKSYAQRYGYFEARLKVPATQGLLPAFWMMSVTKTWPPELDVMEAPTHQKDIIQRTVHWLDSAGTHQASACKTPTPGFSSDYHQYGALWTPQKIVYYMDRVPVAQVATPPGLNVPMFMMLNVAVGGDWVGKATAATPIPAEMLVDNVAAYTVDGPSVCGKLDNGMLQCPAK
jgi:beta-glucanase (GH16 family)